MARPKGVIQKRNLSKYWLPDNISLVTESIVFTKETKLTFLDAEYGEFISTFKNIQDANCSTHPEAVKQRRNQTNLDKYGTINPGSLAISRSKAKETYFKKTGYEHSLKNPEVQAIIKSKNMDKYGVESHLASPIIREKIKNTNIERYGFEYPIQNIEILNKLKKTFLDIYGVDNPSKCPEVIEKILKKMTAKNGYYESKPELEVKTFIRSFNLECESGFLGGSKPKQIDMVIKSKNIMIEYNGLIWHCERNPRITPRYHLEKTEIAKEKGYKLIHIFEHEWKERNKQVKSFLQSMIGCNTIKLNARDCEFKEVPKNIAKSFLNEYHILGSCNFKSAYGLFHNDELISLATFNLHHRNSKELILNRYVCKTNVTIRGGLSKITLNSFKLLGKFYTWIDKRFSDGDNWVKCGWSVISVSRPDYFYYNPVKNEVITKQSRKDKRSELISEIEQAKIDGYSRVFDCGKIKLLYNPT